MGDAPAPYPSVRVLLERYGLAAKKALGQNFLVSDRALRAIAEAGRLEPGEWAVEIGPGLGSLTAEIVARLDGGRLICIERDPDMVHVITSEFRDDARVQIKMADALTVDYAALATAADGRLVAYGNLPYHVASQILFALCAQRRALRRAVVMVQKEMAERIVASPGSKAYGAMGVLLTTYFDAKLVTRVGAGSFLPVPKVDSAVVRLDVLPDAAPRVALADEVVYRAVVHAAFGQRRKMLRNALAAATSPELADKALASAQIDGTRRGETLSIAEFARLSHPLRRTDFVPAALRGERSDSTEVKSVEASDA